MTITIHWCGEVLEERQGSGTNSASGGNMEEQRGVDKLELKQTRCCGVRPEKSTDGKDNELPGEYHYKCPKCGANPAMIKIIGG